MAENEQSMEQQFVYCENIVEDLLKDRLGPSNNPKRNEKLRHAIEKLQSLDNEVERLSLFSTNDQADELPTSTLRYLLIPPYLAYLLQEIQVEIEKRRAYLTAAKSNYREFLQNLLIFELINFKLPWVDAENHGEGRSGMDAPRPTGFEAAVAQRQQKMARMQQMEQLERALDQLRLEERRDNDEAAQREVILVLIRLWSIRAIKELGMIDEELSMLEHFETIQKSADGHASTSSREEAAPKLKPFIIARTEQQKRVFGLGYPSIPTVTVDEWFDQMQKSGGFGKAAAGGKRMESFTINKRQNESEEEEEDERNEEERRQAKIRMDEWKDMNPRGSGNTYNKG